MHWCVYTGAVQPVQMHRHGHICDRLPCPAAPAQRDTVSQQHFAVPYMHCMAMPGALAAPPALTQNMQQMGCGCGCQMRWGGQAAHAQKLLPGCGSECGAAHIRRQWPGPSQTD